MNKKEYIIELAEKLRDSLSVSEVIGRYLELKRHGNSYMALCPFHNDVHIGSFMISDKKKIWKCFACGEGGDVISFYAKYKKIKYSEAILELGVKYGFISVSDYTEFTKRKITEKDDKQIERIYKNKDKNNNCKPIAHPQVLDKVYKIFINTVKEKNEILTEEHKRHLLSERMLTEHDIEKGGYFTFPTRHIMKPFLENLKKNNLDINVLRTIPGFFYDKDKEEYTFYYVKNGGIGIPIHNEYGQIVAIQIRRNFVTDGRCRYIWFSSSFAETKDNLEYGTSPGAPLDVVIPDNVNSMSSAIFVTEGRFKAVAIAKKYNSICISVQGVSAWGKIQDTIQRIKKIYSKKNFKAIYIAYDGDMGYNSGVFQQALKMGNTLSKDYLVFYTLWNDSYGKGIDDLINSNNENQKIKIPIMDMNKKYLTYQNKLKKIWETEYSTLENMERVPKEVKKDIYVKYVLCA